MSPPGDLDGLSPAELKDLVLTLLAEVAELGRTVAAQRDEIARLKGGPPRPNIKPSGMEQASHPEPAERSSKRPRGSTRSKLSIDEEREVALAVPPHGARFKGYTSFVVQDLVIRRHVADFRCERWQSGDGHTITAPLPDGINGHFGPHLRRFVLALYHQAQVTVARATRPRTASVPRSATRISPGSAPPLRRAALTSSPCCGPAMAITSSMPRRLPICANARSRPM